MPNIGAVLREEITRLSKRVSRSQVEAIRKASAQHRRQIAALRRDVAQLARQVSVLARRPAISTAASVQESSPAKRIRFVAKGLRSQRQRLGLSAAQFAKLVGVSEQSIYNWEHGVTRPRSEQLGVLATLRAVHKREAKARLEQLASQASKRRRKS